MLSPLPSSLQSSSSPLWSLASSMLLQRWCRCRVPGQAPPTLAANSNSFSMSVCVGLSNLEQCAARAAAQVQLDDTLIIYDGLLRPTNADGGGLPPALTRSGATKVFIVPSPSSSRGRQGRTVNVSSGLHPWRAAALQAATLEDIVLIGLGHDPTRPWHRQ